MPEREVIRATFVDDGCDTRKATEVATELIEKKARLVLGHVCSSGTLPASILYAKAGVLKITAFGSKVTLTERGLKNVFRVAMRADIYCEGAATLIAER